MEIAIIIIIIIIITVSTYIHVSKNLQTLVPKYQKFRKRRY